MAGTRRTCKVTKEEFLVKLFEYKGNAYKTYTEMGVPYSLYLEWREDPKFEEELQKSRKKMIEFAENKYNKKRQQRVRVSWNVGNWATTERHRL